MSAGWQTCMVFTLINAAQANLSSAANEAYIKLLAVRLFRVCQLWGGKFWLKLPVTAEG